MAPCTHKHLHSPSTAFTRLHTPFIVGHPSHVKGNGKRAHDEQKGHEKHRHQALEQMPHGALHPTNTFTRTARISHCQMSCTHKHICLHSTPFAQTHILYMAGHPYPMLEGKECTPTINKKQRHQACVEVSHGGHAPTNTFAYTAHLPSQMSGMHKLQHTLYTAKYPLHQDNSSTIEG